MKNWLLFFVIVAVLLSCACPPWERIYRDGNVKRSLPLGYAWLWNPPSNASAVDFGRVTLQVGALLFLGGCIMFSRHIFQPIEEKTKKRIRKSLYYIVLFLVIGFLLLAIVLLCEEFQVLEKWQKKNSGFSGGQKESSGFEVWQRENLASQQQEKAPDIFDRLAAQQPKDELSQYKQGPQSSWKDDLADYKASTATPKPERKQRLTLAEMAMTKPGQEPPSLSRMATQQDLWGDAADRAIGATAVAEPPATISKNSYLDKLLNEPNQTD